MFLAMGCDVTPEKARKLYLRFKDPSTPEDVLSLNIVQYAQIINAFVEEDCDPVEGVIETIRDKYDPEGTGVCRYIQILQFMKEYNYLEGDPESVVKVLETFKYMHNNNEVIEYGKAIKQLIQS